MSGFSVENFLSHSAEKNRRATLWGVTNFGYRKILCFRGLCHSFRFAVEIFCLTVPITFVGESSTVALVSGTEKIWRKGGAQYQDLPSNFFCLTVPKKFVAATL